MAVEYVMYEGIEAEGISEEYEFAAFQLYSHNSVGFFYPHNGRPCRKLLLVQVDRRHDFELVLPRGTSQAQIYSVVKFYDQRERYVDRANEYTELMAVHAPEGAKRFDSVMLSSEPGLRGSRGWVDRHLVIEHTLDGEFGADFYRVYDRNVKLTHVRDVPDAPQAAVFRLDTVQKTLFECVNDPHHRRSDEETAALLATCPQPYRSTALFDRFKRLALPDRTYRNASSLLQSAGLRS